MTDITMILTGAQAKAEKNGPITAGMTQVPVLFFPDESWEDLRLTPVFRAGDVVRDGKLRDGRAMIPGEVLDQAGQVLMVGAQGTSRDGTVVIPTTWARVGVILEGAKACGVISPEPDLTREELKALMEGTVEGITIPVEVESLRPGAFYGCRKLAGIYVPEEHPALMSADGVLYSKDGSELITFPADKWQALFRVPETVTRFAPAAFAYCSRLERLEIGPQVQQIPADAFSGAEIGEVAITLDAALMDQGGVYPVSPEVITEVVVPEDAAFVALRCFEEMPNVDTVRIYGDCVYEHYREYDSYSKSTVYYNAYSRNGFVVKKFVIGGKMTVIDEYLLYGCTGATEIELLEGVTQIGSKAFQTQDALLRLTIPQSVTAIGTGVMPHSGVLIRGVAGSFAQTWAAANGYSFEVTG